MKHNKKPWLMPVKARRIADNLGVSLGRVVSFNDYNDYSAYSEPVSCTKIMGAVTLSSPLSPPASRLLQRR